MNHEGHGGHEATSLLSLVVFVCCVVILGTTVQDNHPAITEAYAMHWGLFSSAFLSATLLPGSSEALLLYLLSEGGPWLPLVITATAGNLLGSLVTYGMGRLGNEALHHRWLRVSPAELARAETWFRRWGRPVLVLAWLPVVGDPLCLLAGLLRVGPIAFLLLVGIGKLARYAFLAWLVV